MQLNEDEPARPVTVMGDVWLLGEHRVMCGDSMLAEDVAVLMAGSAADLVFTSPPYAAQRDYGIAAVSEWDALMKGAPGEARRSGPGEPRDGALR